MSRARLVIVALLALAVPACSLALTDPLRRGHPAERAPDCSAHISTIVTDVALAAVLAIGAGLVVFQDVHDDTGARERDGEAATNVGAAAVYAASAYYGVHQRNRCEAAYAAHDRWIVDRPGAGGSATGAP